MSRPPMLRIGSLFAGIGGFDLAASRLGWSTAWYSEIDPFCCAVMAHHFPEALSLGDITQIDWSQGEPVDLLCGGFPCQPASTAGKRDGTADARWLWPECARALRELRPRWAVFENVRGLLSVNDGDAFRAVLGDLAELGYDATWGLLSAADVGAPHRRERVWIVASDDGRGSRLLGAGAAVGELAHTERQPVRGEPGPGEGTARAAETDGAERERRRGHVGLLSGSMDDATGARHESGRPGEGGAVRDGARRAQSQRRDGELDNPEYVGLDGAVGGARGGAVPEHAGDAMGGHPWRDAVPVRGLDGKVRLIPAEARGPESPLWPVASRVSHRVAQLRAVGNTIVPACAYQIFQHIADAEAVRAA